MNWIDVLEVQGGGSRHGLIKNRSITSFIFITELANSSRGFGGICTTESIETSTDRLQYGE